MHRRPALVYFLFFVSGAAGLLYEVLWSRLLRDVFGVTAHAVAAVLATYLGGLALGSWALGRAADRSSQPLRLYGLLEIGVGLAALLGTLALRSLEPIHVLAATHLAPDSPALAGVRLLLASVVVLPATILMGGTLPAMTRFRAGGLGTLGRELSFLYALNTAGAVAGSLAAGFLFLRVLGVHPTLWLAVLANALVGAGAIALSKPGVTASEAGAAAPAASPDWLLPAVAASGVASLALEVIWTRLLVLIVGGSTHAFVTMLAVFLVGISLGGFLARRLVDRLANPRRAFGWLQAGIAAATLASIPALGKLVEAGQVWMLEAESHWFALTLARFGIAFAVMIVPTTLIGMTFPLAGKLRVRGLQSLGGELGAVYGANTLGNIFGALLGGFVLLPLAGLQRAIPLLTLFNLASAAWGFFPTRAGPAAERRRGLTRAAPVLAGLLAGAVALLLWKPRPFVSVEEDPGDRTLFYQEGLVSTVKVIQRANDARQRVMLVDGVRIGQSAGGIDSKQQVLAHFPFLLLPPGAVRQALTIGLGSGVLAGEVAAHPGVEHLDVVELSPSVIEGARAFREWNGGLLDNPRAKVIADDGINFLKRSPSRYDAIISDGKSRLGQAGNAPFFSAEFYRSARDHLTPGGLMIQWMPLEEVPGDLRIIVRTFLAVFPHAYLWMGHSALFLAGLQRPLALDLDHVQDELDASPGLRRYGWRNATDLPALLVADSVSAAPWLGAESTINSLERPVLEFYSPRALAAPAASRIATNAAALATTHRATRSHMRMSGPDAAEVERSADALDRLLGALQATEPRIEAALLDEAAARAPEGGQVRFSAAASLVELGDDSDRRANHAEALALYRAAVNAWPESLTARLNLGVALAQQGDGLGAQTELSLVLRQNPDSGAAHQLLGRLLQSADAEAAAAHYREALRIAPDLPEVHYSLASTLEALGRPGEALGEFREAMRLQPGWAAPMADAALLLAAQPDASARDPEEAIRLASQALKLTGPGNADVLEILAAAYAAAGHYDEAVSTERKAAELVTAAGDKERAAQAASLVDRYRGGKGRQ